MRPLFIFETPNKRKSSTNVMLEKISEFLIPELKSIKYKSFIQHHENFEKTPLLSIEKKNISILTIPWIRPYDSSKTTIHTFNNYPRLNIQKDLKEERNDIKLFKMQQLISKYQIYFLVVLQKDDGNDLYWLQKYKDIPLKFWETAHHKKGLSKEYIHFPQYTEHDFVNKSELKKQLNEIFEL